MWRGPATALALVALALLPVTEAASPPARAAATCADYENQADARRAADTRDADGDGICCESLPCPCLRPGQEGGGGLDAQWLVQEPVCVQILERVRLRVPRHADRQAA